MVTTAEYQRTEREGGGESVKARLGPRVAAVGLVTVIVTALLAASARSASADFSGCSYSHRTINTEYHAVNYWWVWAHDAARDKWTNSASWVNQTAYVDMTNYYFYPDQLSVWDGWYVWGDLAQTTWDPDCPNGIYRTDHTDLSYNQRIADDWPDDWKRRIAAHEQGHAIGLAHPNWWDCGYYNKTIMPGAPNGSLDAMYGGCNDTFEGPFNRDAFDASALYWWKS